MGRVRNINNAMGRLNNYFKTYLFLVIMSGRRILLSLKRLWYTARFCGWRVKGSERKQLGFLILSFVFIGLFEIITDGMIEYDGR